jgi:hypothetical protein
MPIQVTLTATASTYRNPNPHTVQVVQLVLPADGAGVTLEAPLTVVASTDPFFSRPSAPNPFTIDQGMDPNDHWASVLGRWFAGTVKRRQENGETLREAVNRGWAGLGEWVDRIANPPVNDGGGVNVDIRPQWIADP